MLTLFQKLGIWQYAVYLYFNIYYLKPLYVLFTANRWISLNEQELFISDVKLQYEEAVQYGRTNLSAELWVYASATQYFNVSQQFGLNGSEYWITGT